MTDPRLIDLDRRIAAAAAKHGVDLTVPRVWAPPGGWIIGGLFPPDPVSLLPVRPGETIILRDCVWIEDPNRLLPVSREFHAAGGLLSIKLLDDAARLTIEG